MSSIFFLTENQCLYQLKHILVSEHFSNKFIEKSEDPFS